MKNTKTYNAIKEIAGQIIKNYRADLTKHDRSMINKNETTPFIHYTRESGTHIIFLGEPDTYPAPGETQPYIFGHCNRQQLLNNKLEEHNAIFKSFGAETIKALTYSTGSGTVYPVNRETAAGIIDHYITAIKRAWNIAA